MLRALYKSASLRAAVVMGFGGVAFTAASLILAKTLPPSDYGLISLILGIVGVAGLAAPLGLDLVIGRRGLPLDARLRHAILSIGTLVAIVTSSLSAVFYRLDFALLISILVITVASGLIQASAAHFQGQQRFGPATWIMQLANWTLLITAALTGVLGLDAASATGILWALLIAAGALFAWILAKRDVMAAATAAQAPSLSSRALMEEGLSLASIHVANALFMQLERLMLAPVAGVQALALFGVAAALVISPFRMLQMSVLFTLIPSLRSAASLEARRRLLAREALLVGAVIGAGSVVSWYLSPPLANWFLSGRYELSPALMCAALVSGALKLCSAFATGTVIALAEDKQLRTLSLVSWATIGVGAVGAFLAAPWGLVGALYGISVGWLVRTLIAAWLAMPHLRRPAALLPEARFGDQSQMPRARR
jgi:O-antigen/teichoic acid export membrane protein